MHFLICEDAIPVPLLIFILILSWESICTPDVFFQEIEKELSVISHHNDELPSQMNVPTRPAKPQSRFPQQLPLQGPVGCEGLRKESNGCC